MTTRNIFKSITVGGVDKNDLLEQLKSRGIQFNEYAHLLFDNSNFSNIGKSENFNLVRVNLLDLQINGPATYSEIILKATGLGLSQCPLYLGAFLRLEYLDQPEGPYLTIASEKPKDDENYPNGFYIRNLDNVLWLRGYRASSDYEWPIESQFIFLI